MLTEFPTDRQVKLILTLLVLYFAGRLVWLAFTISPAIPPDELTHAGLCGIYAKQIFLPANTTETYRFGLVTNIPWLYYWLMGKLLLLNLFGVSDLVWLRLLQLPLALATVWYVCRTLRLLTTDSLPLLLLVTAMTNTMMFTFLSAAVSYDNLTTLLATAAVYHLLAFSRRRQGSDLVLSLLCQLAGCLTKTAFLPLVPILLGLLCVREYRQTAAFPAAFRQWLSEFTWQRLGLLAALLAALALNLQLYGGNYRTYGKLKPEMYDVLPFTAVMENSLAARDMILLYFQEGKVTREQAVAMASRIAHPGERLDAQTAIRNYEKFRERGGQGVGFFRYAASWAEHMAAGIFGVQGRLSIVPRWPTALPLLVLGGAALAAIALRWRPGDAAGLPVSLAIVVAGYAFFLLYRVNYRIYLENGSLTLALQGRYLFPVIGPAYLLASYYLPRLFPGRVARLAVVAGAMGILLLGDFPLFLARITPLWFVWPEN